jgi:colanic acid/amylovoran biosynthesis glycosyltransferase
MFNTEIPVHYRNEEKFTFLTVARLHWKKGLLYTLEALKLFKDRGYKFQYIIIGNGPQNEEILFAIHQLGLTDYVALLGQKTSSEVKYYMSVTSIYLQYSISEGFCNSVLEAQAMGLLCVVSDAEGLSENVLHEVTGWVVPKRNPIALLEMILKVINLPYDEKQNIRNNAQKRIRSDFNLEKQQMEFSKFYY